MTLPIRYLALAGLCGIAAPAHAESDFEQWLTLSAKADLSDSLMVQGEIITRFSDNDGGLYEAEAPVLIGYKLSKTTAIWAGYVHNPTYSDGDFVVMERRAREQITVDNFATIGSATLSGRLRFEQRWRDGIDGTGWRVRPYLKLAVPLGAKTAPTLNVTTEPFINLNTTSFQSTDGLDRVRNAISLSFPVGSALKLEAGYLNQHRFVSNGVDRGDHALTATLSASF